MRSVRLSLAIMLILATRGEGQDRWLGRPATRADSISHSILEAEARGRLHPRAVANNTPAVPDMRLGGASADRRCVNADADTVRSGDFLAGPFSRYTDTWRQGSGKLWWHPSEMAAQAPVLIVHAVRLDQAAESRVFESSQVARPSGPGQNALTGFRFYPTGIRLPTVGRWMMVARAGNNWGCFILTVG